MAGGRGGTGGCTANPGHSRLGRGVEHVNPVAKLRRATSVRPGACTLDWDRPHGRTISLKLIRHLASKPEQRIGSMFINPGGPGDSGVGLVKGPVTTWTVGVRAGSTSSAGIPAARTPVHPCAASAASAVLRGSGAAYRFPSRRRNPRRSVASPRRSLAAVAMSAVGCYLTSRPRTRPVTSTTFGAWWVIRR